MIIVGLCALTRAAGTARAEPPRPCQPPKPVLVFMCLSDEELYAVRTNNRSFSPIVAEYLARQDVAINDNASGKKAAKRLDIAVAKRLIGLGMIQRIEDGGEKLEMYLEGVSGQWYRTREKKQYEVFRAADAVDPAGLFIVRVQH